MIKSEITYDQIKFAMTKKFGYEIDDQELVDNLKWLRDKLIKQQIESSLAGMSINNLNNVILEKDNKKRK